MSDEEQEFVRKHVEQALKGENPLAEKFGPKDDPALIDTMIDHVLYRADKEDDAPELKAIDVEYWIDELVDEGILRRISRDNWIEDKVTLA